MAHAAGPRWTFLTNHAHVLLCLARGCSNQEIADELGLKLSTVRNNIAAVYEMLGLTNRVQALLWVLSYEELAQEVLQTA